MLVTEAVAVIEVLLSTHDYCSGCALDLRDSFIVQFPEFTELAVMMYNDEYEGYEDEPGEALKDKLPYGLFRGGRPDEP